MKVDKYSITGREFNIQKNNGNYYVYCDKKGSPCFPFDSISRDECIDWVLSWEHLSFEEAVQLTKIKRN